MVSKWEEDSQNLIEDREQDLELAAIFGKMLLDKNKELSGRVDYLEQQLIISNDQVNQLRQRISVKNKLLKSYSQDIEDMEMKYDSFVQMEKAFDICRESLERKSKIQEENVQQLQLETFRLASLIKDKEKTESNLGKDFVEKLEKMSDQVEMVAADLTVKTNENSNQEERIQSHLSKIEKLQKENADLCSERTRNQRTIQRMESSLQEFKMEVLNWKDKYDELIHFMEGIQGKFTSLKSWYKRKLPIIENTSLASELEQSHHMETEFPYGIICDDGINNGWYRGTPDGRSESGDTAESIPCVEKENKNECLLFDSADEKNSKTEETKELALLKQCSELNSGSFGRLSEQLRYCKDNFTAKHRTDSSYVQSNIANCYPKLFRKLTMVKQLEGSEILRQWQKLAVKQKCFALSSGLYTVLETCVD